MSKKLTSEQFIERANKIHSNKYNYSKIEYIDTKTKICVICPNHGEFFVTPNHHLRGIGCPKCAGRLKSNEEIISQFNKVHGNKYDYSKVEYKGSVTKVCIICRKHGEFWQKPSDHLSGYGCPHCRSLRMSTEKFIEKAKGVHGDNYDYSKTEYKGCRNLVKVICNKHGEFEQTPYKHLQGHGCPYCNESHLENNVKNALEKNDIEYIYQCNKRTFKWLGGQSLDFYLPKYNIAIECQGEQHYNPIKYFGGEKGFKYRKKLDEKKKELCEQNKIKLIYFDYKENDINELVNIIQNETSILRHQIPLS
jgi:hypothetical protein